MDSRQYRGKLEREPVSTIPQGSTTEDELRLEVEKLLYIIEDIVSFIMKIIKYTIVGHVSRYSDKFQLVGVDCKRVKNFAHFY